MTAQHSPAELAPANGHPLPPQDIPAEQAVLGAMLLSKDAIADVVGELGPGDFYRPAHEAVFRAVLDLYGRGEPADPVTVTAALTASGELARVGGAPYLHTLMQSVPTAANAGYYAKIVSGKATLRRLVETGLRITQLGYGAETSGADPEDAVDAAQQATYDLATRRPDGGCLPLERLLPAALDELEELARNGRPAGVRTGLAGLDHLTTGFQPSQLVIVAARPAIGKSTVTEGWALHAATRLNTPTLVFSLEMDRSEITMRLLSAAAGVSLFDMRAGRLNDLAWVRLSRVMGEVADAPLYIDDSSNLTLMEIRAKTRRMVQRHGVRLVIVDYVQLVTPARRRDSQEAEVAELSRGLKLLAKELGVVVVAVAQLNREPERRHDKKPQLADLRSSGSLEQDADIVVLLHRPDAYPDSHEAAERAREADLILAKHRNGPTGVVTVFFQPEYCRFVSQAPRLTSVR